MMQMPKCIMMQINVSLLEIT